MAERIPYNAHTLENILSESDVARALGLGWAGSFKLHRLIQHGEGGRLVRLHKGRGGLGLDLTDEDGVATVRSVRRDSVAAVDGLMRPGDIVRSVDGHVYFTCEAVAEALRSHVRGNVTLGVVRQEDADAARTTPACRWSDAGIVRIGAGAQHSVTFEASAPSVLRYELRVETHDIVLRVYYAGELVGQPDEPAEAGTAATCGCGRGLLLDLRTGQHTGSLALPNAGRYAAVLDNAYSYLRTKSVRFSLGLVPMPDYSAAERHHACVRIESELDARRERGAQLSRTVKESEPRLVELRAQLADVERTLSGAKAELRDNERGMREAQSRLAALQTGRS